MPVTKARGFRGTKTDKWWTKECSACGKISLGTSNDPTMHWPTCDRQGTAEAGTPAGADSRGPHQRTKRKAGAITTMADEFVDLIIKTSNPTRIYNGPEFADRLYDDVQMLAREVRHLRTNARPINEWTEEDGPALWWRFPIVEPPYSGTPLDDDFPDYVTHWTAIVIPSDPR